MSVEVERKYINVDLDKVRKILNSLNLKAEDIHFESNNIFDTKHEEILNAHKLLRLRSMYSFTNVKHILTLKLPLPSKDGYKMMDEREIEIVDEKKVCNLLEGLGYGIIGQYEKVREIWHYNGVEIDLDQLPFMDVVELEGEEDSIELVANALEIDNNNLSVKSYHELHQIWLKEQGLPLKRSFVFDEKKRKDIQKQFGIV